MSSGSFVSCDQLSLDRIQSIFKQAQLIKSAQYRFSEFPENCQQLTNQPIVMAFFEASTRTRVSFDMAAQRLQMRVINFFERSSSLAKGESELDTLKTLDAMGPSAIVVRCPEEFDLLSAREMIHAPLINGGWGKRLHPTQALLDAFTIQERLGQVSGQRVLFIGDIRHSRVAQSGMALFQRMDAKVALCAPDAFIPVGWPGERFSTLSEGLKWATVVICLRVQFERHDEPEDFDKEKFVADYSFTTGRLGEISTHTIVMHPGPANYGVEMTEDVLQDPRCCVLQQVENGVAVRAALISSWLTQSEEE